MKTKDEVIEMIKKNMTGCYTCEYSCDEQGNNHNYGSVYVDDLFDEEDSLGYDNTRNLEKDTWEMESFYSVTNDDIDIEEWAQEFDKETIEQLRKDIDDGCFYKAIFYNDCVGTRALLVWE